MTQKKEAILEILSKKIESISDLNVIKRKTAKKFGIPMIQSSDIFSQYRELLKNKKIGKSILLENILKKRAVRTLSGIAPVAVLTNPYPCPGKCAYCPTEKNVPQSYLSNEPAVMRAIRCGYDPYIQVQARLKALINNGHNPEKIELIVIGGTWSVLPEKYKYFFIWQCFKAANEFKFPLSKGGIKGGFSFNNHKGSTNFKKSPLPPFIKGELVNKLLKEQEKNEKAKYRIIGITLETRPDYINEKELWQMRELGCTRVELGVQAIDDEILKKNKRGHGVKEIVDATKLLKDFGFKVTYHIMSGLPGSNPKKDLEMFKQLFSDEKFQPDQIKFYPTIVTKGSLLYKWWKAGKYKTYSDEQLQKLIIDCKKIVPSYVRIIRLIRDIPSESIQAGNRITNLRQVLKDKGIKCKCIRCREAREKPIKNYKLRIKDYAASEGEEYFIEFTSKDGKILYGFCRLRITYSPLTKGDKGGFKIPLCLEGKKNILLDKNQNHPLFPSLKQGRENNVAIIRELHVYGELVPIGNKKKVQHAGLGKKLIIEAESIAKQKKCVKIIIISGIGVRDYYRKLGYKQKNTYMVKNMQK